jgi:cytochrome oxidase assembly protein ShyY1
VLRTLRQPRYAALSVLMLLVALICVGAGTWQIYRFTGKVHANDELRANFHAAPVPLATVLRLAGAQNEPGADSVRFKTVIATGSYDAAHQTLLRERTVHGRQGYYLITPLRTSGGVLLVARGFVAGVGANSSPPAMPAPPSGTVTVHGRVLPADPRNDEAAALPGGQVRSVNPGDQAARLGVGVYDGYADLLSGQPGVDGLTVIPRPSLSNPAGGAVEPQHFAYIIQWYLFAALALAAPFAMARAETKMRPDHDLGADAEAAGTAASEPTPDTAPTPEQIRAAKLADRYGRAVR